MFSTTRFARGWFAGLFAVAACATGRSPVPPASDGAPTSTVPADAASAPVSAPDSAAASPPASGARPSAGCTAAPAVTGPARTVTVDGSSRSYTVVAPPGAGSGKPRPLVFLWHGLGGSGTLARRYFGVEAAAGAAAVLVYPDALPLPSFGNRTGWDLRPDGRDLRFFDAMLAEVARAECFDLARVFSAGHSFGGYMTNALGCHRSSVLRGIAPVAGGLVAGGCATPAALPAWIAHGMNDGTVPFAQGEAARAQWAGAAGCGAGSQPVDPSPCVAFETCRAGAPVIWCVHDLDHAWPPFAGAAIWAFFAAL
jgi:polyhydroxybutyrate depolymerase